MRFDDQVITLYGRIQIFCLKDIKEYLDNKDNWYSIEVTFEYKPVIKDNCISLEIKYSYDNIGDAGCDATPEEIKLVKNIIKQIKTNEKTKGFTWNYNRGKNAD